MQHPNGNNFAESVCNIMKILTCFGFIYKLVLDRNEWEKYLPYGWIIIFMTVHIHNEMAKYHYQPLKRRVFTAKMKTQGTI